MKKLFAAAAAVMVMTGCATNPDAAYKDAVAGQVADVVTTGITLATVDTLTEANPLGIALLPIKAGALYWANSLPEPDRKDVLRGLAAAGWGPAVSNICLATGGTNPVCLSIGLGVLIYKFMNPAQD